MVHLSVRDERARETARKAAERPSTQTRPYQPTKTRRPRDEPSTTTLKLAFISFRTSVDIIIMDLIGFIKKKGGHQTLGGPTLDCLPSFGRSAAGGLTAYRLHRKTVQRYEFFPEPKEKPLRNDQKGFRSGKTDVEMK